MTRGEGVEERAAPAADDRFVAQLDMLHSMAATLASLDDVEAIGAAITEELGTILDYHNCRVYVMQGDGETLMPVAFRGKIFYEYEHETMEELVDPGRRRRRRLGRGAAHVVAHPRRATRPVRRPDPRYRRHPGIDAGCSDDGGRGGTGCHRPLESRLRRLR